MLYAIIATDHADSSAARDSARAAHLDRLKALQAAGRLLMAGPFPAIDSVNPGPAGFTGSLIVAEFATLVAAQDWAAADPYHAAGAYRDVTVKPFKHVLP